MSLKSVLREPLLHFLAIGAALFLYFHWNGGGTGPTSSRIVLTSGQINQLAASFAKTWQGPPAEVEIKGLVDDWVREKIAVREAMAMGLDRDDTVIRRRLRQKLEFVVEDVVASAPPTEQELQAWLVGNADAFRIEPQVAFCQVYVSQDRRGAAAEPDARALLARLRQAGPGARIDELGDPIMLPQEVDLSSRGDVARTFGDDFAGRVDTLSPGMWAGPVQSGFGLHLGLVRIHHADGRLESHLLRPATPSVTLGGVTTALQRAFSYVQLGFQHILLGVDHLLFVLGLLLIVSRRWMLIKTITSFTVAHSITLAIAPLPPLNAAIALSILFLGPEIARVWRGETSFTIRHPWVVAFAFGLLHGFGFASGLSAMGLPKAEIPLALLLFNVGVEIGQVAFVVLVVQLERAFRTLEVRWPHWAQALPGHVVGSLGAYWTIQRTVILFGGLK